LTVQVDSFLTESTGEFFDSSSGEIYDGVEWREFFLQSTGEFFDRVDRRVFWKSRLESFIANILLCIHRQLLGIPLIYDSTN